MKSIKECATRILANRESPEYLMSDSRMLAAAYLAERDDTPIKGNAIVRSLLDEPAIRRASWDGNGNLTLTINTQVILSTVGTARKLCAVLGIEVAREQGRE